MCNSRRSKVPPAKSTVCVIDDDLDVLGSLQFMLETDGFDVCAFRSGAAMLNTAVSGYADCFVIDYRMPNMNGIDLANYLRKRNIASPIILITGDPDENIFARAAVAGIRHVLRKPHLEESLVMHIRGAIQEIMPYRPRSSA
jgi:two-component system response regulator FixJ